MASVAGKAFEDVALGLYSGIAQYRSLHQPRRRLDHRHYSLVLSILTWLLYPAFEMILEITQAILETQTSTHPFSGYSQSTKRTRALHRCPTDNCTLYVTLLSHQAANNSISNPFATWSLLFIDSLRPSLSLSSHSQAPSWSFPLAIMGIEERMVLVRTFANRYRTDTSMAGQMLCDTGNGWKTASNRAALPFEPG